MDCILQAPLSTEFSSEEYWSGLPFPSPGELLNPGIEPRSPALQAGFFSLFCFVFLPSGPNTTDLEVMGIWVTGTSKVFRKGVEIVMFFDIMLRCLVWCMDEAGDQLSIIRRSSKGGGLLGMGFRTNMRL